MCLCAGGRAGQRDDAGRRARGPLPTPPPPPNRCCRLLAWMASQSSWRFWSLFFKMFSSIVCSLRMGVLLGGQQGGVVG